MMAIDPGSSKMADPAPIRIFCSDLDGTLVGNPESAQRFKAAWEKMPPRRRPLLVYSSGRLVDDMRRFFVDQTLLPIPDYSIGGVGTQIYDERAGIFLEEFHRHLAVRWDLKRVQEIAERF